MDFSIPDDLQENTGETAADTGAVLSRMLDALVARTAGSTGELRDYAAQYFHYAMAFPTFISAMHAHTDDIATRQLLLENLIEEGTGQVSGSSSHRDLFIDFAAALGLNTKDWNKPSKEVEAEVQKLENAIKLIGQQDKAEQMQAMLNTASQEIKNLADKGIVPPGIEAAHQKVRSASIILPPDQPFKEAAKEAFVARPAVAPVSV